MLGVHALALLSLSLLAAVEAGSTFAIAGAVTALAPWAAAGFALVPIQLYRLIEAAPDEQNGVLAFNASAIYVGQGLGAVLGSVVLGYATLTALGYAGALCAMAALLVARLGSHSPPKGA